jgi:hypothetical protein
MPGKVGVMTRPYPPGVKAQIDHKYSLRRQESVTVRHCSAPSGMIWASAFSSAAFHVGSGMIDGLQAIRLSVRFAIATNPLIHTPRRD